MRVRVGIQVALLGVLAGLAASAVDFALAAREGATYGIEGDTTALILRQGEPGSGGSSTEVLVDILADNQLAVAIGSNGDGPPGITLFDPASVVDWVPDSAAGRSGATFLFTGTYSATAWTERRSGPLLTAGSTVAGIIPAPPGAEGLEWAQVGQAHIPPGNCVLSTADPGLVRGVVEAIEATGMKADGVQEIPLAGFLANEPLLVASILLLLGATIGLALTWPVQLSKLGPELVLRKLYGATPARLALGDLRSVVTAIGAGSVGGVLSAAGLVALSLGRAPNGRQVTLAAGAIAVTVVLASLVRVASVAIVETQMSEEPK